MLQLWAHIRAIFSNFSHIFIQFIRLDIDYFHRITAFVIRFPHSHFAMRSPHVTHVPEHVSTGAIEPVLPVRSKAVLIVRAIPLQFRNGSSNRRIARYIPGVPKQAARLAIATIRHPVIVPEVDLQRHYYIWSDPRATALFFILNLRPLPYKFRLFILHVLQRSSDPVFFPFRSSFCFKIFLTIFSSQIMYIKPSFVR